MYCSASLSPCPTICLGEDSSNHSIYCLGEDCIQQEDSYNKFSVPEKNTQDTKPLQVNLDMTVFSISNINFAEGLFEVELGLQMSWKDNKMQVCQCSQRQSREFIRLPGRMRDKIWMPDLVVKSVVDVQKEVGISKHSGIRLVHHHDSTVVISDSRILTVLDCNFIAEHFPFDKNLCLVRVCSDLHPSSKLNITMDKLPNMQMQTSPGFDISVHRLNEDEMRISPLSVHADGQFRCGGFKLGFTRSGEAVMTLYTAIMGMLVIMTTLTVILPYPVVDRLAPMSVLLIGALTVFSTVNRSFPRADSSMSPLVIYILVSIIISFFLLLGFCVILNIRENCRNIFMEVIDKISLALGLLLLLVNIVVAWKHILDPDRGRKGVWDNLE